MGILKEAMEETTPVAPVCGVQPVSILCAGLGPVLWGFQGKDRSVSLIEACDLSSSLSSLAHEAYLGK